MKLCALLLNFTIIGHIAKMLWDVGLPNKDELCAVVFVLAAPIISSIAILSIIVGDDQRSKYLSLGLKVCATLFNIIMLMFVIKLLVEEGIPNKNEISTL